VYAPGTEVVIGPHRFKCTGVLGRGSFSEVWSGEEMGTQEHLVVALKDIGCPNQSDLQQALFEANMLLGFERAAVCSYAKGAPPPHLRIPRYLSHRVDKRKGLKEGWRMRMAMTRVPGEPLDAFLKRAPPGGQDVQTSVRRGCMLAMQMIKQLAPSLEIISTKAVHRDVNAHNVLMSDALEGGPLQSCADPEEAASRANFWLIDFGLAVDSTTWHTAWKQADIGGDCRYWPQSSWFVSFWGADEISAKPDLCNQYVKRLDIFGLGITALELLCTTALDGSNAAGCLSGSSDGLRGSWRRLLNAWTKYWTDVTRWHTMIYRVFSQGKDVGPLYQELAKEHVVDKILTRMADIRKCLRACVKRTEDPRIQSLLSVLAEMLDESSNFGLREAVNALGGECAPHPTLQRQSSQSMSYLPPKQLAPCPVFKSSAQTSAMAAVPSMRSDGPHAPKLQWCAPTVNSNSYVPAPQSNSFVPLPINSQLVTTFPEPTMQPMMPANNSYVPMPVCSGSYVPPPMMAPAPTRQPSIDAFMIPSNLKNGPARAARPRFAGA